MSEIVGPKSVITGNLVVEHSHYHTGLYAKDILEKLEKMILPDGLYPFIQFSRTADLDEIDKLFEAWTMINLSFYTASGMYLPSYPINTIINSANALLYEVEERSILLRQLFIVIDDGYGIYHFHWSDKYNVEAVLCRRDRYRACDSGTEISEGKEIQDKDKERCDKDLAGDSSKGSDTEHLLPG